METSYWSRWWELETSGSGAMLWKGDHSPRVQKDRKPTLRGKWESVFSGRHMDNVPKQTHAVSVMTHSLWQQWQRSETKRTIVFSCISHSKVKQTDGEKQKSSQGSGNEEASSSDKSEIPCRFKFCKKPSCKFWHSLPPCVKITSLKKGCINGDKCPFRQLRQKESPAKSQRKMVRKDQLRCWRSPHNWVVYLKILIRENLFNVKKENWDQNTPSSSPKTHGAK